MKQSIHTKAFRPLLFLLSLSLVSGVAYSQLAVKGPQRSEQAFEVRALEKLMLLEPVKVTHQNAGKRLPVRHYSFQAEKFQAVFPELLSRRPYAYRTGKNSSRTIELAEPDLEGLIPVLVAAIQELQAEIQLLKKQLGQAEK